MTATESYLIGEVQTGLQQRRVASVWHLQISTQTLTVTSSLRTDHKQGLQQHITALHTPDLYLKLIKSLHTTHHFFSSNIYIYIYQMCQWNICLLLLYRTSWLRLYQGPLELRRTKQSLCCVFAIFMESSKDFTAGKKKMYENVSWKVEESHSYDCLVNMKL